MFISYCYAIISYGYAIAFADPLTPVDTASVCMTLHWEFQTSKEFRIKFTPPYSTAGLVTLSDTQT